MRERDYEGWTKTDSRTHPKYDIELGLATLEAVDEVLALARSCVEHMTSCGILQWDDLYPDRDSIEDDLRIGAALLARHRDEVIAYLALDSTQDTQYAQVDWRYNHAPVAVIHRLMVSPAWQGRGLGRWCITVAEQAAAHRGYKTMRLEAFTNNPRAIGLYERCGYRAAGAIHFRTGEFTCFEKALAAARQQGHRLDFASPRLPWKSSGASHATHADMRWPVNRYRLKELTAGGLMQAGGHMDSALDHADIRGFQPHISVGPEPASH